MRVLVSVYVLYLAYGLIKDYGTATNQMLSLAAIIIFVIGGGFILLSSGYKLAKGDYDDGSEEDDEEQGTEIAVRDEGVENVESVEEPQSAEDENGRNVDKDGL